MISISPLTIANFRLLHCFLARCKILPASLIRLDLILLIRARLRSIRPIWMLPPGRGCILRRRLFKIKYHECNKGPPDQKHSQPFK